MVDRPRPLVVIILDGWGVSFLREGNAIASADTPTMDSFAAYFPSASIHAASIEVGLPWGEVGNSETGHRNIGAGRIQYQMLPLIDKEIEEERFFENESLLGAITYAQANQRPLHLLGILSPGGVHGHMNHLFALLELCRRQKLQEPVYIHIITDGRDTMPESALAYLQKLEGVMTEKKVGKIASVTGRFYAMDRNENWERTEAAYACLTGQRWEVGAPNAGWAIEQAYAKGLTDEMIPPTAITKGGAPVGAVAEGDPVIFFNFRPDRARQLAGALADASLVPFSSVKQYEKLHVVTFVQYDEKSSAIPAYIEEPYESPLAKVISDAGLTQFHIAETEKYAHVTYYLNVGHENPFPGEDRFMVQSTAAENFADEPYMRAEAITDATLDALTRKKHAVYFVNYANADMVGHTGNFEAAVTACAFLDQCLRRLYESVIGQGGAMIVTADHGNAEEMLNPQTMQVETDHTSNPVPFHYVRADLQRQTPKSQEEMVRIMSEPVGILTDVAPTILDILQVPQPDLMTGVSLLPSLQ